MYFSLIFAFHGSIPPPPLTQLGLTVIEIKTHSQDGKVRNLFKLSIMTAGVYTLWNVYWENVMQQLSATAYYVLHNWINMKFTDPNVYYNIF